MNDLVVVRVDGGIASQINFYALGQLFCKKGYRVKYDISWFANEGKEFYCKEKGYQKNYSIKWDIPKIFPELKVEIASTEEIKFTQKYRINDERALRLKPPFYLEGYNFASPTAHIYEYLRDKFVIGELQTNSKIAELAREICISQSCGIHIRRGDLSSEHIIYGKPTSIDYFLKSIELINKVCPKVKLFLFSDDIKWVKENLISHIVQDYVLCDVSTPENGYIDLYLLSRCKFIIGSHGSLGLAAKLLADDTTFFITPKYCHYHFEFLENIAVINWFKDELSGGGGGDYQEKSILISKLKFKYKLILKIYFYLRNRLLEKCIISKWG